MTRSKIQSEDEVRRWYEEGRTSDWMADMYLEKYNIEISPRTFYSLASRRGWRPRLVRDPSLIPWKIRPEHRSMGIPVTLRALARQRAGKPVSEKHERMIAALLEDLEANNAVVHYDPELVPEPFVLIPREAQDGDSLVRQPPSRMRGRDAAR